MAVEFNVNAFNEHYGVGKKYVGRQMTKSDELQAYFEKCRKQMQIKSLDEFVGPKEPILRNPQSYYIKPLHELKAPTLLTRLKRVPSVLVNILKHIK